MAVSARKRAEPEPQFPLARFMRDVYEELRKVVWPTPAELYRYTLVVVLTVAVLAAFIGGVDYGLTELVRRFLYAGVSAGG